MVVQSFEVRVVDGGGVHVPAPYDGEGRGGSDGLCNGRVAPVHEILPILRFWGLWVFLLLIVFRFDSLGDGIFPCPQPSGLEAILNMPLVTS